MLVIPTVSAVTHINGEPVSLMPQHPTDLPDGLATALADAGIVTLADPEPEPDPEPVKAVRRERKRIAAAPENKSA